MTTEQKTADSVLQRAQKIKVGGYVYVVPKATTATLMMASAAISRLPKADLDTDKVMMSVLNSAKDCTPIGEMVATMLVGAKGMMRGGLLRWFKERKIRRMSAILLERHSNEELKSLALTLLSMQNVADFFALTAFLSEANILKPTKAEAETTASGLR